MSTLRTAALQHPSAASSALTLSNDGSAAALLSSINGGPLAGFRNAIINGNFEFWQRGTSHSALGYGSADRWFNGFSGSACTISHQSFALGQTDVPGNPRYFCRAAVTSSAGASNFVALGHRIEDVRTFSGQTVTVSFYAKADAIRPVAVEFVQSFGTGGSPSADVPAIGSTKVTLGTTWQKITVTTAIPSVTGKTLGSAGDDFLSLYIWLDGGSTWNSRTGSLGQQSGTFDIAMVQVEPGSVATPFEQRPRATELALCQRYYEKSYDLETAPGAATYAGIVGGQTYYFSGSSIAVPAPSIAYKVAKRATPVLSFWNGSGTANQYSQYYNGSWTNVATAPIVIGNGQSSFLVYPNGYVSSMFFHYASSAEL